MLTRALLILAILVTITTLATWLATGRDYYTKYQVVEEVEVEVQADDPLANTGFFDEAEDGGPATETRTETRDAFRFGLLPAGQVDKNFFSVLTLAGPAWALAVLAVLLGWFRNRRAAPNVHESEPQSAPDGRTPPPS